MMDVKEAIKARHSFRSQVCMEGHMMTMGRNTGARTEGTACGAPFHIGCHLSVTDGYTAMGEKMAGMGGSTFAWFTRNPRGGKTRPADPGDLAGLRKVAEENGFGPLVAHGSYTMNLCSASEETRRNSLDMLKRDLALMEALPGNFYNFHPGAHTGQGKDAGISQIADALNEALYPGMRTTVLLETMAGKGTEIGGDFVELREIIDRVACRDRVGVCLDTCHVWDAGYDVSGDLDGVIHRFDEAVGIGMLKAVHFNDSKNPCGSHRDRHEKIGMGMIGICAMREIALHPAFSGLPFILETPNDMDGYAKEMRMVFGWAEEGRRHLPGCHA